MPYSGYLALASALFMGLLLSAAASGYTCNVLSNGCSTGLNGTFNTVIPNPTNKTGLPIYMAFAYAPGCPHCEALDAYVANLSKRYDLRITYINAVENQTELSDYLSHYNVSSSYWNTVPMLFINRTYCVGDTPCESLLSGSIVQLAKTGAPLVAPGAGSLGQLTILEITGLALVDSVNPCAFAVLIFLLSTLFMRDPTKRRNILFGGVSFALGIFVFYLAIGTMILFGVKSALAIANLKNIYVYGAFGVFTIALGLLNLKDYFAYRALGFAMEVPQRWRPKMFATMDKIILGKIASIPGAFIAGVLVTAFLLPCITGPYFVAGSLLKNLPMTTGILWLAYYNLLFVLPMFIITLLVYFSFTSIEKASEFREKNVKGLHLIAGILLIVVGVVILLQVFVPML